MTLENDKICLSKLIAPGFWELHKDIKNGRHTHYFLKGGRGSAKSSFISLEIVLGMIKNPDRHCVVFRKVGAHLRDSVYAQLCWAIDKMGLASEWEYRSSPLEIQYKLTGQRILFRGADNPQKTKSIKLSKGYIGYIWYEEADQFDGMEEIRSLNQSLMRGGDVYSVFYSYNPPISIKNWINIEVQNEAPGRLVHHSTYNDVPREWLGEQFIIEAEHLMKTRPEIYRHEYMGEAVGTGGEVFRNVSVKNITNARRKKFDKFRAGVDFGYAADPFVYIVCVLEKRKLYIIDEIFKTGMTNSSAAEKIIEKGYNTAIVCDSAEPKSIREFRELGLRAVGAKKGPDSIKYGIKFLQSLDEIIIDSKRCPNAAREFVGYEIERDANGGLRSEFPDKDNHSIDAVRYALEDEINRKKAKVIERKMIYDN